MTYAVAIRLADDSVMWRRFRTTATDLDTVRTLVAVQYGTRDLAQVTDGETGETLYRERNGRGA